MSEFERRVERAEAAETAAELQSVVADLRPIDTNGALIKVEKKGEDVKEDAAKEIAVPGDGQLVPIETPQRILAIFSGVKRVGHWLPRRQIKVITFFGGVDLDFRETELPPGVTTVDIRAVFGGVDVKVPPDLPVLVEGFGIFGGFDSKNVTLATGQETGPVLRFTGFAVFAGVSVKAKKPRDKKGLLGRLLPERKADRPKRLSPPDSND